MVKSKPKNSVTIDQLAGMVQDGFNELRTDMDGGFNDLRTDMDDGFNDLRTDMNQRFDRIENILIAGHDRRIEILEDKILRLAVAAKVKFN